MTNNVSEIPVGQFDAVRTLRQCLQMAEEGEINRVLIVAQCVPEGEITGTEGEPYVYYSEMPRYEILWLTRFANSFVNHRFFGKFHEDED